MIKVKQLMQCALLIFHTSMKCYMVIRECREVNFAGYANVLLECIKFLAHNSQLEVVARIKKRIQEFEHSVKLGKKEDAAKAKAVPIQKKKMRGYKVTRLSLT